jgi:anti-anti-sigma factor
MSSALDTDVTVIELPADPCGEGTELKRARQRLLRAARASSRLVIDCRRVRFFGAGVLGLLLRATQRSHARRGDIVLCGLSPLALEVLHITRLDTVWPLYRTREEALRAAPLPLEPLTVDSRPDHTARRG